MRTTPSRLRRGDTIGLISPSGPTSPAGATTPEHVAATRARLAEAGFETRLAPHALDVRGYLGGGDEARAEDLQDMFADGGVQGILCIRGGYGSMRLLDALDYDLIRRHPKVFIGYSDVTALHLALARRAGLVTFHGPMATALAKDEGDDLRALLRAVTCPEPLGRIINPPDGPVVETLVPGIAEGMLLGGNLAVLTALLGTPYLPSFAGTVLFIEDIVDHAYRLDRKLVHLRLANVLRDVAGIVVGECRLRAEPKEPALTIREILEDLVVPTGRPAIFGLACGHGAHHLTLPLGVRARLDATRGILSLEEPAVT